MCDFPSKELLAERRRVCVEADAESDPEKLRLAMQFAMKTDELRWMHEELTGCPCWYEAVKKAEAARA